MQTLRTYGWKRVLEGVTTVEEVMRVTKEDEIFTPRRQANRAGDEFDGGGGMMNLDCRRVWCEVARRCR